MGNRFIPSHDPEYLGPVVKGFILDRNTDIESDNYVVLFGRAAAHSALEINSDYKETEILIPEIVDLPEQVEGNFFVRFEYDPVSRPRLDIDLFAEDDVMKLNTSKTDEFAVSLWSLINSNCGFFSEGMKLKVRYGYDLEKIYVAKFILNLLGRAEKSD